MEHDKLRVVVCEPGKVAYMAEIPNTLSAMQEIVGGWIETYAPFRDNAVIVCNEEGKFNGTRPCRAVYDSQGSFLDAIFGKFFICASGEEDFVGLTNEQAQKYLEQFKLPENFMYKDGQLVVEKYEPEGKEALSLDDKIASAKEEVSKQRPHRSQNKMEVSL